MLNIEYKYQRICSLQGHVLGYELLIDPVSTMSCSDLNVYEEVISNYKYTLSLFERLSVKLDKGMISRDELIGKRIFINVEIEHLNFVEIIRAIDELSTKLARFGGGLVIEITERVPRLSSQSYTYALDFLRMVGVTLAVDDLNISEDYRHDLVKKGFFDFVKLEWDVEKRKEIVSFISNHSSFNIILERVEDSAEVRSSFSEMGEVWGLQGFYCCRGVPVYL